MKRAVIALVILLALCGASLGMSFPEIGVCNGDGVRLRAKPGTKGKVIGRVDAGTQFVVLGESLSGGQKWYRIDHPTQEGTAYISAQYVNGYYNAGELAAGETLAGVRLTLGITPEKTRVLLGKPLKSESGYMEYDGCNLWYEDGYLRRAEVYKRGYRLGDFQVGDSLRKLMPLGLDEGYTKNPEGDDYEMLDVLEGWTYSNETNEEIFFQFDGKGHIGFMSWYRPVGEG